MGKVNMSGKRYAGKNARRIAWTAEHTEAVKEILASVPDRIDQVEEFRRRFPDIKNAQYIRACIRQIKEDQRVASPDSGRSAFARTEPPPSAQGCRWPIGHPGEPDFHFCERPAAGKRPYCASHCAVAYQSSAAAD